MGFKLVGCTLSSSATILGGHFIGEKIKYMQEGYVVGGTGQMMIIGILLILSCKPILNMKFVAGDGEKRK